MNHKENFLKILYRWTPWVWIFTLFYFSASTFYVSSGKFQQNELSRWISGSVIVDIMLGIVAFCLMIFLVALKKGLLKLVLIIVVLGLSLASISVLAYKNLAVKLPTTTKEVGVNRENSVPAVETSKLVTKRVEQNSNQVDCVGPDYQPFKTTEEKCKEFQNAWGFTPPKKSNAPMATPSTSQSQQMAYSCYTDSSGVVIHTRDATECSKALLNKSDYESRLAKCSKEKETTYNSCQSSCKSTYDEGKNACAYAYSGPTPGIEDNFTKYTSCNSEAYNIWLSCGYECLSNAYGAKSKTCP